MNESSCVICPIVNGARSTTYISGARSSKDCKSMWYNTFLKCFVLLLVCIVRHRFFCHFPVFFSADEQALAHCLSYVSSSIFA